MCKNGLLINYYLTSYCSLLFRPENVLMNPMLWMPQSPNYYGIFGHHGPSAYWQKPPYSYIALITMAISSRHDKKMTLNQVMKFLLINHASINNFHSHNDSRSTLSSWKSFHITGLIGKVGKIAFGTIWVWTIVSSNLQRTSVDPEKGPIGLYRNRHWTCSNREIIGTYVLERNE